MRQTAVTNAVQADVALRIDAIRVERGRPLIICDADEVIADFIGGFEPFLHGRGLYFNWASYRLNGNIRRRADGTPADADEIRALIAGFYDACIDTLAPVDGAVAALAALAHRAGVVVLSNQPPDQRERREAWLARLGIGFPTVANAGPKGPAVPRARRTRRCAGLLHRRQPAAPPQRRRRGRPRLSPALRRQSAPRAAHRDGAGLSRPRRELGPTRER